MTRPEPGVRISITKNYVQNGIRQGEKYEALYRATDGKFWLVQRTDTGKHAWVDPALDNVAEVQP